MGGLLKVINYTKVREMLWVMVNKRANVNCRSVVEHELQSPT